MAYPTGMLSIALERVDELAIAIRKRAQADTFIAVAVSPLELVADRLFHKSCTIEK